MFSPEAFSLQERRALVTGGATGIGRAIAEALAACGAEVVITSHRSPPQEALEAIRGTGRRAEAIETDLGRLDEAGARDLVATAESLIGPLDILVSNAGIIRRHDALEYPQKDWREVMAVNLDTVWYLSQAAARSMTARRRGTLITTASVLSFQGGIRVPAYSAAKHAVTGLVKAMANEWAGLGIRANAIAPGYVATKNTRALQEDEARYRALVERIPAGRFAEAEEIAGAAVFLASDAASYVNGTTLVVDGGWLAR